MLKRNLAFLLIVLLALAPFITMVKAVDSGDNISGMNVSQFTGIYYNDTGQTFYTSAQTFTVGENNLYFTTMSFPLTKASGNDTYSFVNTAILVLIAPIDPIDQEPLTLVESQEQLITGGYYNTSSLSSWSGSPIIEHMEWLNMSVIPVTLLAHKTYAMIMYIESLFDTNTLSGVDWWGNNQTVYTGGHGFLFNTTDETWISYGTNFSFGFSLNSLTAGLPGTWQGIEGQEGTGITGTETMFLGLFLSLGLGAIGFGMGKGKEPLMAVFMIFLGLFISYLLAWLPAWVLAASFAVLGMVLADRFRGVIKRG